MLFLKETRQFQCVFQPTTKGVSLGGQHVNNTLPIQIANDQPSLGMILSFPFGSNVTKKPEVGSACMEGNDFL